MSTRKLSHPNQQLRHAREQCNWSQEQLAELLNTSPFTVHRWEKGSSNPGPYYRQKLIEIFQQPLESLGLIHEEKILESGTIPPLTSQVETVLPLISPPAGKLLGRDELLQQVRLLLGNVNLPSRLALYGLPGAGKSMFAVTLALDPLIQQRFPDGIMWAGVGRTANQFAVLNGWSKHLGLTATDNMALTSPADLAKLMHERIGNRRILFIIDDIWSSEDAFSFVIGGSNCSHIITTRSPAIAHQFAPNRALAVSELDEVTSVDLIAQYVPDIVNDYPDQIHELIRLVGGLPLALTLIGQALVVEGYSGQKRRVLAALTNLRETKTRLLQTLEATPLDRPSHLPDDTPWTLFAMISASDQTLTHVASQALRALSVFPPKPMKFSEEAAGAICDYNIEQTVEALDELTDSGLVESVGGNRYTLHQTIADYVRILAPDQPATKRFVAYAVNYCQVHMKDYPSLEAELPLLLDALRLAQEYTYDEAVIHGAIALSPFLIGHGLFVLVEDLLHIADTIARQLDDNESLGRILVKLGKVAEGRGDYEQATSYGKKVLDLATLLDNPALFGLAADLLGIVTWKQGDTVQAEEWLLEGIRRTSQQAQPEALGWLLFHLGYVKVKASDFVVALQYLQQGGKIARELHDSELLAGYLNALGILEFDMGHYVEARQLFEEGLVHAEHIGNQELLGFLLGNLGAITLHQGDVVRGVPVLQRKLALARQYGLQAGECGALLNLGNFAQLQGLYEGAQTYYTDALTIARKLQFPERIVIILCNFGELMVRCKQYKQAEVYLTEGMKIARDMNLQMELSTLLSMQGELFLAQNQIEQAHKVSTEALQLAQEIQSLDVTAIAYLGLAKVAAARGNTVEAYEYGSACLNLFRQIGGHYRMEEVQLLLDQLSL